MKVWTVTDPEILEQSTITDAVTPDGYAKVRVVRAGISMTDVQIYRGSKGVRYPQIPGHQGVGVISEINGENASGLAKGQRVAISPYLPCGKCLNCNDDKPAFCSEMGMMGVNAEGLLRDFAVVPFDNLFQLPTQVKDDEAVFVDNIAVAMRIFHDLDVRKGDYLAVAGASLIGLALSQIALYYQAIPIVIDNSDVRINLARNTGVYYIINSSAEDPVQKIMQITGGRGCERVSYLVNGSETLQHALDFASFGGRVCLTGWNYVTQAQNASLTSVIAKQLTVLGVNNGNDYITVAINLLANRAVDVAPLLGKTIGFDDVPETFRDLASGAVQAEKIIVKL